MGLNILVIFDVVNMKRLRGRKTSKSLRFVNIYLTELIENLKKKSSLIRLFWKIGVQNSFCKILASLQTELASKFIIFGSDDHVR